MAESADTPSAAAEPLRRELHRFDTADAGSFHHVFRHPEAGIELHWNARNHRKRRSHPLRSAALTFAPRAHHYRLWGAHWASLSWWVAAVFTVGSLVWLVNGLSILLPLPGLPLVDAQLPIWSALIGGGVFVIGAYLSWLEVLNAPRYLLLFSEDGVPHSRAVHDSDHRFRWIGVRPPSWGLGLNLVQMLGASIFFVPCVLGTLLSRLTAEETFRWYWVPQMVGAFCFFVAAWMAMREVQNSALKPAWGALGWWSGLFNLLGAIGFFLCAWFGFRSDFASPSMSDLSTFLGSVCFLVASLLMLVEVVNPEGPETR